MDPIILKDFPIFVNKPELSYLDNAATSQKPSAVINAISNFYAHDNAPVHRGIYALAESATLFYEQARTKISEYIGADSTEVIFTKGTTEGINFIAQAWAERVLQKGDEIILTELEHNSNVLPWIRLAQKNNIKLKYVSITPDGDLDYQHYLELLSSKTKLVSVTACSNALGTTVNLEYIIKHARAYGAAICIDAAQTVGRRKINVHELGLDFMIFSGHKMLGPTGVGILYIAKKRQDQVEPYQVGGGMALTVDYTQATWLQAPSKYEAGTPPIAQAIGLAAAVTYLQENIDLTLLRSYEADLTKQLRDTLKDIKSIRLLGPEENLFSDGHMVSFISSKYHAHDIAAYLNNYSICVRAGTHCAQLAHNKLGIESSVRISFYCYTTQQEIAQCADYLKKLL